MGVSSFPRRQWVTVVRRGCEGCVYFIQVVWFGDDRRLECKHWDVPECNVIDPHVGCDYRVSADTSVDEPDTQGRLF